MSNRTRTLWRGALVVLAIVLPALMGVQLVRAVSVPATALDSLRLQTGPMNSLDASPRLPAPPAVSPDAQYLPASPVTGVLYTRGRATVDWNGVSIPVQDGSYAYEGGESIGVSGDGMGLLRLSDGSSVFLCGGSRARLSRAEDGRPVLEILKGASRFVFRRAQAFQVRAGETVVEPSSIRPESTEEEFFVGEAKAYEDGGCLLCALKNDLSLALERAPDTRAQVPAGNIARLEPEPGPDGALRVGMDPIPGKAMSLIRAASAGDGAGAQYLCRCDELEEFLRERGAQVAEGDPDTPLPETEPRVPESMPEILPPDAPPLALAEPGPPDPFDPNVLPPPAAGEPFSPVITVAPPATPGGRNGGGGIASRS